MNWIRWGFVPNWAAELDRQVVCTGAGPACAFKFSLLVWWWANARKKFAQRTKNGPNGGLWRAQARFSRKHCSRGCAGRILSGPVKARWANCHMMPARAGRVLAGARHGEAPPPPGITVRWIGPGDLPGARRLAHGETSQSARKRASATHMTPIALAECRRALEDEHGGGLQGRAIAAGASSPGSKASCRRANMMSGIIVSAPAPTRRAQVNGTLQPGAVEDAMAWKDVEDVATRYAAPGAGRARPPRLDRHA